MKSIVTIFSFALLILTFGNSRADEEVALNGTLVIDVHVQTVSRLNGDPGLEGDWTNGYWVTNVQTGKSYGGLVSNSSSLQVLEVPEGIYCVDTLITGGNAIHIDYCGEPYFRIKSSTINNVGRWRFGVRVQDRQFKLFASMEKLADVLKAAKERFPEKFN
ncbi:hypothetical protein AAKU67_004029 [Oxalobacteraceae bacterium GrIS 2.11]